MANYTAKVILTFSVEAETPADAWKIANYSMQKYVNGSTTADSVLDSYDNVDVPEYDPINEGGVQIFDEAGNTLLVDGDSNAVVEEDIQPDDSTEPDDNKDVADLEAEEADSADSE